MRATSPSVEDDKSDSGDGVGDQNGAGKAVEEWAIWANVDSDEEDDDEATADIGTGANEAYNTTPGIRLAAIPITEWKSAEMSHISMRQPAYNTSMWSYPPRQKVQRRAREGPDGQGDTGSAVGDAVGRQGAHGGNITQGSGTSQQRWKGRQEDRRRDPRRQWHG